jgi:hypothetical protein
MREEDLIGQGQITTNFTPSFDLPDTFNGYWSAVMPTGTKTFIFKAGQDGSEHARPHADAGRPPDLPPRQAAILAGPGQSR